MKNVAVVGASPKEERYSNKAILMLAEKGHNPIPVSKTGEEIVGRKCYENLSGIPDRIDTVTMYVGVARQDVIIDEIVELLPRRVIFNPGAENPEAYGRIREAGIEVVEACTLVLLKTEQF
jgi:predicted CoA-binding protein